MGAIKGVGEGAVEAIVSSREEGGIFQDPFDFIRRVDLRSANKRSLECMIQGGAWDAFKLKRSQYLTPQADGTTFMDHLVKAGQRYQQGSSGPTLFSDSEEIQVSWPTPPETVTWSTMEALRRERDLIGMYVSANPLDDYFVELRFFSKGHLGMLEDLEPLVGRKMALGGICSKVRHQVSRTGKAWGAFTMEDYHGTYEFRLFGENYLKFKHLLEDDLMLFISGAVTERSWRNKEDGTETRRVEFQVNNIELLSDIREKMAKCLTIDLALDDLDDEVLLQLNRLLAKSKSKKGCEVRFQIRDTESESEVQLPSRSMKLQPSNELLDGLSKVKGLKYHLN
jgi:DNA polymerase-3 subunit alpha